MVTVANLDEATKISELAVGSRKAACATTIPVVHSLYWWEGKLTRDQEALVLLKTTVDRFQELEQAIRQIHSYKVPEIIAIPLSDGLPQYLEWVQRETT